MPRPQPFPLPSSSLPALFLPSSLFTPPSRTQVTGAPVAPTPDNPHPFAYGLRRWLAWMLGDLVTQLSPCFSGGRHDALVACLSLSLSPSPSPSLSLFCVCLCLCLYVHFLYLYFCLSYLYTSISVSPIFIPICCGQSPCCCVLSLSLSLSRARARSRSLWTLVADGACWAQLFVRSLLTVRLAHATAALTARDDTRRGVDASFAVP